jgi:hypothetical protein
MMGDAIMRDFAAAVSCIDGRYHEPLVAWMRHRFEVRHVDLVTAPGVSAELARGTPDVVAEVANHLSPSLETHQATVVVVAAHEGCAADPRMPAPNSTPYPRPSLRYERASARTDGSSVSGSMPMGRSPSRWIGRPPTPGRPLDSWRVQAAERSMPACRGHAKDQGSRWLAVDRRVPVLRAASLSAITCPVRTARVMAR